MEESRLNIARILTRLFEEGVESKRREGRQEKRPVNIQEQSQPAVKRTKRARRNTAKKDEIFVGIKKLRGGHMKLRGKGFSGWGRRTRTL